MKDSSKNTNLDDSFESENENISLENVKLTSKSKSRQRKAFYLSNLMTMKDRVIIFRQDFPEFAALDEE